jgi:pimeloyl-ACP methyl ester carboxylesterase
MSAPEYLSPVRIEDGIPPQVVADDISAVASTARKALRLPGTTPVVLFGVSRGADLAAVAAARPSLRGSVRGVLVVGLTAEEEFVRLARPYDALRFVTAPVCLIQSTNDEYVPAADARRLFGLNSNERKFQAIESRDHSFSDARGELYGAMLQSLQWVESRAAVPGAP